MKKIRNEESEIRNQTDAPSAGRVNEERIEIAMGNLLRAGVLTAAGVVLLGGIIYLFRHGTEIPDYHLFAGGSSNLRGFTDILRSLLTLSPRGIIQFGLFLLILTPIARVIFALISFVRERDRNFIFLTLVVLVFLLYGFLGGKV